MSRRLESLHPEIRRRAVELIQAAHDISIGELGEELGLQWGGRFPKKDMPHFQMTFGFSWQQLLDFHKINGLIGVWSEIDKVAKAWP
jgi:hypothetical protein